ncbi:MAG: DNA polymerase I, partial [Paludibacter sp.]|nr:DNA polymerase I [Paludibacter sp.]
MKKLFLIDAYAIIYRAYYAFIQSPRVNSKGLNTSAIYGFVNTLQDVLNREKPTHIAVAFDPAGPTFRHEMFEQYKAQREKTPEDIKLAIPYIKKIISAYNIPILEVKGYEADDVIGTIAKVAETQGFEVFMLTPDKDYGQLVSDHIFMYRPRHSGGFETLGIEEVKAKYGIDNTQQVIDLLGLMGDASDNIPGCPGVGEKTAVKLLQEFGSITNLLENTKSLKGALKIKIEDNRDKIIFSQFLATIKTDVPIEFDENSLKKSNINENELRQLFDELEFRHLKDKILSATQAPKTAKSADLFSGQLSLFADLQAEQNKTQTQTDEQQAEQNGFQTINTSTHNYYLIDTSEKRSTLISNLLQQKSVCFDTETTAIDTFTADMVGMSFAYNEGEAFYVNLPTDRAECKKIVAEFQVFFANTQIEKIGQNIKFDILMLAQYGIQIGGKIFDTMIAHYLLQPELRHGMDYLAEIYLKYRTVHYDELFHNQDSKVKNQDIRKVDLNFLKDYAAEDADITLRLKQILEKEIAQNSLEKLFYDIEMPLVRVLATMEQNGVKIDSEALQQSSEILTAEMNNLEKEIIEMAGTKFNVSSPAQVGEVLFDRLKIDERAKRTKSGQYSTAEDVLEKLHSRHPIVNKILDYRGLKKLLSTYIDALPQLVNQRTGHIHTSFNQTVTSTGRLSSTNPNLQNIPVRDEQGKEIRRAFIPDENCVFLSADYSQIELRIMADLSGDQNMLDAFNSGYDIHAATAAKIYKIPIEQVSKDMRRKAKTANFGIIYGISVFGLAERLNIPRNEAKELIDGYFETYPDVKKYMDAAIAGAKESGFVETIFGRKRYLNDINSQNSIVRGYAERNAINAPIQGSAADIIKIAMVNVQNRLERENLKTKMTLQVHDELNFSVPIAETQIARQAIIEEMQNACVLKVPLIA